MFSGLSAAFKLLSFLYSSATSEIKDMANFNEQYSKEISVKIAEIMGDSGLVKKAVYREAVAALSGRVIKRFFEDVYASCYEKEELDRRPFLNIGPGSFRHPMWRTADKKYDNVAWTEVRRGVNQDPVDYCWDIYSGQPLKEVDGFFKVVYTSHVIEHLFPKDMSFMVREIKRLLEPGGIVRVVCPDAELMANAYQAEDWQFFLNYLIAKTGRIKVPLGSLSKERQREISAAFLLEYISLLTNSRNPHCMDKIQCVEFLEKYDDIYEGFDEALLLSSREVNKIAGGHVNWFTADKLVRILKAVGFSRVEVSGYQKSKVAILRDSRFFDRTDPEMSVFIEATK